MFEITAEHHLVPETILDEIQGQVSGMMPVTAVLNQIREPCVETTPVASRSGAKSQFMSLHTVFHLPMFPTHQ